MNCVFLLFFTLILTFVSATLSPQEWTEYKNKYGKSYFGVEELLRKSNYISSKLLINAHNMRFQNGAVKFRLDINQFSDMSNFQYNQMLGGPNFFPGIGIRPTPPTSPIPPSPPAFEPPVARNWTQDGGGHPIRDQGIACNSAWAFAPLAALEAHHFVRFEMLPPILSAQNLIDCAGAGKACMGDQKPSIAYDYIINTMNVNSEDAYIYTGVQSFCQYNPNDVGSTLGSWETIPENDDQRLKYVVGFQGPVVVGFDPFSFEFRHYKSGVFEDSRKSFYNFNYNKYYMAVIGYGRDTSTNADYWILKNSMGKNWGESGYMRILRSSKNPIAKSAIFPNV